MRKQKSLIYEGLSEAFQLPIFEDEIAEDEVERFFQNGFECFILETGEFEPTDDNRKITQNIRIYYYSENRDDVDEMIIDIISVCTKAPSVTFTRSTKERVQVKDVDRFIDRATIQFRRVIPIECQIRN